jgi:hypothetical protein
MPFPDDPLSPTEAKRRLLDILEEGAMRVSGHARRELANDTMTVQDVENILRGGTVEPPEWENGSWRYRVRTARMVAVVAFESEAELVVVTAWRLR